MNFINKKYVIIILSCVSFCCTNALYKPTLADVEEGKKVFPDLTIEQLNKAVVLYGNRCGSCHKLYVPSNVTSAKWAEMLPKMQVRAKLNDTEFDLIKKYVKSKSGHSN